MPGRRGIEMTGALALVAPGTALRDGLDRVVKAKRGALLVIGDELIDQWLDWARGVDGFRQ
jgi:diadenylate cyclase